MAQRLVVTGLVQGVGYRASFERQALRLGLRGWVRNRRDGSVEATVEGAAPALEEIVAWARKGPPSARVDHVAVEEADNDASDFRVLPTL
ncbi:acylphosphatase [Duganella callida]|uniref:acylphosphatase n=1 Tax=Duganella callida TaxID=2561932 RepID=A0A4Y9S8G7_9BURK|nr:acylphosphatase [Duganella callida]TFW18003.1 acylphosphatase [Duganella callida]